MQVDLEKLSGLADKTATSFGLQVLDVRLGQQGKRRSIEITIYRPGGRVSLSDCEQVSRALEEVIDQESQPLMDASFFLEVQSPGTDRKLSTDKEFAVFSGSRVEVKTKLKVDGLGSAFAGTLVGLENGRVLISQPSKLADSHESSHKRKAAKAAKPEESAFPESLEVEVSNLIHVRLIPEMPKDAGELPADNGDADSPSASV